MSILYVCPTKDAECGYNRDRWCAGCPQWAGAERKETAVTPWQDVGEFISFSSAKLQLINGSVVDAINPDAVRSFIIQREEGHVRVPVELLYEIQQSIGTVDERSPQQVVGMFRSISAQLDSLLNASKEPS